MLHGFFVVLTRSSEELLSMQKRYEDERLFFNSKSVYSNVPVNLLGMETLVKKLGKVLNCLLDEEYFL